VISEAKRYEGKFVGGRFVGWLVVSAILVFLTVPTILVVFSSFNPTSVLDFPPKGISLRWYLNLAERPDFRLGFVNTALIGVLSTFLALLTGIGLGLSIHRGSFPGRQVIYAGIMSPLVLPGVIIGVGLLMVASKTGGVGRFPIVIVAHALMVLPFVLRSILISLENIDPNLEKAAAILGANATKRFFHVTLPLLRPGIGAGILFALIMSINEFTVSLFVTARATQTMPVVLFNYTMAYIDPTIAAVSTVYIITTIVTIWLLDRAVGIATILKLEGQG